MKSLNEIIAQFPEVGKVGEIIPLTAGLINQTYKVQTEESAGLRLHIAVCQSSGFQGCGTSSTQH